MEKKEAGESVSFYESKKAVIQNDFNIEVDRDFVEFLSFSEPFLIVAFCAGSNVGSEVDLKELSKLLDVHETKLYHISKILERSGVVEVIETPETSFIKVIEVNNIFTRRTVFSVIYEKREEYAEIYNKLAEAKLFTPRVMN